MLNLFSISNFNLFRNAGFWAFILIALLENFRQKPLTEKFANHEVDRMVHALKTHSIDAPVLFLGDSVAGNVFKIFKGRPDRFAVFASNHAIETTGQWFVLRRYLNTHPTPGVIAYMSSTPIEGDLDQRLTENFVQRVFLQWNEILWMGCHKLDPAFTLKSVCYKFSPSFRFRLHLQEQLIGKTHSHIYSGLPKNGYGQTADSANTSLTRMIHDIWERYRNQSASERSWKNIVTLLSEYDIPLHVYPAPTSPKPEKRDYVLTFMADARRLSQNNPQVILNEEHYIILPKDHFQDGTHLSKKGYAAIRPFQETLLKNLLEAGLRQELERSQGYRQSMYSLQVRNQLDIPGIFELQGLHSLEGKRSSSFQWTRPRFNIGINTMTKVRALRLETAKVSPKNVLYIEINGEALPDISLDGGQQIVDIPIPSHLRGRDSYEFSITTSPHLPNNGDRRQLGIALHALDIDLF